MPMNFEDIARLPNVKSIGSDLQKSVLHDPDVTIFLKNNYRLISTKTVLGSSIDLRPADDQSKLAAYRCIVINSISSFHDNEKTQYVYEKKSSQAYQSINEEEFAREVSKLVGNIIWNYLQQRHSSLLIARTVANYSPPSLKNR